MRKPQIRPTIKQHYAWQALQDPNIDEIHYGGAAGGGKSWFGCESRLVRAYQYPGYKSFIGRTELTRLMASTYVTWTKVCAHHGIPIDDWAFNGKYHYIQFKNGSRIDLLDLAYKPSDPMYERLGGLEYTDGWIDEAGEVPFMAVDILRSRVGRHMNKEFNLNPDMLYTYNPNKGWVYRVYKQWRDKTLPASTKFIQALYKDNPHTAEIYGKQLDKIVDPAMKQRLKFGSFEYDADPSTLIDYEASLDLFTNTVPKSDKKYLTADVARHGVDKTVEYLWEGMKLYGVKIYAKQDTEITSIKLKSTLDEEQIPRSQVIADEDGIGGAVVDQVRGIKGFIANSPQLDNPNTHQPENFASLKAQCTYKAAELINNAQMAISVRPEDFHSEVEGITYEVWKEMLIEEMEWVKSKDLDKDTKLRVIAKDDVKDQLGRSPDFWDPIMMRAWFEYKPSIGTVATTHYSMAHSSSSPVDAQPIPNRPKFAHTYTPRHS